MLRNKIQLVFFALASLVVFSGAATAYTKFTTGKVTSHKTGISFDKAINTQQPPLPAVQIGISGSYASEALSSSLVITVTSDAPVSSNQTITLLISGSGITSGDYYLTKSTITILSGQSTGTSTLVIADDATPEADETLVVSLGSLSSGITAGATQQASVTIADNDCTLLTRKSTVVSTNGAEIAAYDPNSQRVFTVAGDFIEQYTLNNEGVLVNNGTLLNGFTTPTGFAALPNSVAVKNNILAASFAIRNNSTSAQDSGIVAFYHAFNGSYIHHVKVGYLPDMVTFTPDGNKVLSANEGEPNSYGQANSFDPEGSVSIIDISAGPVNAVVTTVGFGSYNSQINTLLAAGVRIYGPGATVAQDFEPEYIAFSGNGNIAMITLQENNALAELNLNSQTITAIYPLGLKNHNLAGNGMDASDRDSTSTIGKINIMNWPVMGMYQPDAIASFSHNGQDYYFTANEGDSRDYTGFSEEIRVGASGYVLDPTVFPNAATLKNNANLGRLQLTKSNGDIDTDGDYDVIHALGARSFSVWSQSGTLVFDSGDQLEQITSKASPTLFNSEGTASGFDTRSDNKGPEPEGIAIGTVNEVPYVFVGLERTGDIVAYDISNPAQPQFVQYVNTPQDLAVEGLLFIKASDSPTGKALLISTAEVSKTVTVYELASQHKAYYTDLDGDGYGTGDPEFVSCGGFEGYAEQSGDCDDNDDQIYPTADEICDGIDNNCNQQIDEVCGCTDINAHNFNENATIDDGSCETCTDGIKNGTETGVDCGGDLCQPCAAPVAVCGNIVTVYANAGNLAYNGPSTADVYLINAIDLDAGSTSSGVLNRTVARTLTNVAFNWTTNGACIDAQPNGIYNNIDKGIVHRNCLPVTPADFNKIRNFEMKVSDAYGTSTCTGRYLVVNGYPSGPTNAIPLNEELEAYMRESSKSGDLAIFPNPGSETVNIAIPQELVLPGTQLVITNTVGQTMVQIATIESEMISIEATDFSPGLYFVHLVNEGKTLTKKWVKI